MGGFEGGDEGGFWDEDTLALLIQRQKLQTPKQRKTSQEDSTLRIVPSDSSAFSIEDSRGIPLESHPVYKAYLTLVTFTSDSDIIEFFCGHKVVIDEYMPEQNVKCFLLLAKELCNLILRDDELDTLYQKVFSSKD